MRTRLVPLCLVASTLILSPAVALAQASRPAAAEKPGVAGQMTEEAAQARRLFDAERWSEAAVVLKRVVDGDTGDDDGNREIAQYHLAICLHRLQFYQASFGLFSAIAENKEHLRFRETLPWLARLASQLPESADIVERVGRYPAEALARFDNPEQRELYWHLEFLLGRYEYGNRNYEDAIQRFGKVDPRSKHHVKAQFFTGISWVQLRKSVPAVRSFQKVLAAIEEGAAGVEDESRMRDLAHLSMARTYYSSSVRLDDNNMATIDQRRLSAAVKHWNKVDAASEYWLDALFEESWAYFMAGDYPRALGNIHTIESPYFPNAFYPEADVLKAVISFTTCRYDDATTHVARMKKKYEPIKKELEATLQRFSGEGSEPRFFALLQAVRAGKADLSPTIRPVVENALSDRQLLRHLEYVRVLEEEKLRLEKAPPSFRSSAVGVEVADAVELARDLAIRNAGALARARYQRNLDELREHLRNGNKILVDITAALRNRLDQETMIGHVGAIDRRVYDVPTPDREHVIWPFDGEYWRDELGTYRQVVVSECQR